MHNQFHIFRNKEKKEEKHPDYRMMAKKNDELVEIGACWIKTDKNGAKYMSCSLKDERNGEAGFRIVEQREEKSDPVTEYPDEQINSDDIPF